MKTIVPLHRILFFFIVFISSITHARSPFRKRETGLPEISTRWAGEKRTYTTRNSHLEEYPLFAFHENDVKKHLLPSEAIHYKNDPTKSATGAELSKLIEHVIHEIQQRKKKFTHFTLLQKKNFNRKLSSGLIVLRFNDYPFVLKLFMETPETFGSPYGKGIEPLSFFYMAGGANRHLTGLTRIKNAQLVNQHLLVNYPLSYF